MRMINSNRTIKIPDNVEVTIKTRFVTVKGPRGTLERDFKHLQLDIRKTDDKTIKVEAWFANKKDLACVRTFCSHVENMIKGTQYGYQYHMRSVYAHFPINLTIVQGGKAIDIRNFLGEKITRHVEMRGDVKIKQGDKDELILQGNDIEMVGLSAALVHQSCLVKKKDIRKFLDGKYLNFFLLTFILPTLCIWVEEKCYCASSVCLCSLHIDLIIVHFCQISALSLTLSLVPFPPSLPIATFVQQILYYYTHPPSLSFAIPGIYVSKTTTVDPIPEE